MNARSQLQRYETELIENRVTLYWVWLGHKVDPFYEKILNFVFWLEQNQNKSEEISRFEQKNLEIHHFGCSMFDSKSHSCWILEKVLPIDFQIVSGIPVVTFTSVEEF